MSDALSTTTDSPAGRSIPEFARLAGIGRATFYLLPPDVRPITVKIGKRSVVIESPAAWLQRMAERGGVETLGPQKHSA